MWDGLVPVSEADLLRFPRQPRVKLAPTYVRYLDGKLRCWVRTATGIKATCSCGETSGRCKSWRAAQTWKDAHVCEPTTNRED